MPLYLFNCGACRGNPKRMIAPTPAQALVKVGVHCPKCGAKMVLTPRGPSSQVMERLDDGIRPRVVERLQDAERLYKERDVADTKKRNGEEE